MDAFVVTVVDRNVKHGLAPALKFGHPDHESQALMFACNVKYIFEDDEESVAEGDDGGIENVVVIETNGGLKVTNVELISERFKLLEYETAEDDNHEVVISAMSKFEGLGEEFRELPLERLVEIYRLRNDQLESLFNTL
ncbi:LANO_0A03598g1_1 [Lachancea nothofagi CBS 11611]|uniref:LANO_0A03598g1_1 n=1 Tax=Lachancea nothofagi CBS 11611 TaxID=1266666 RepID=A0A1G4IQ35_9SACH|nr:LANO_0A03598g1_1 [Lachancea nothofagi CBS 11611]